MYRKSAVNLLAIITITLLIGCNGGSSGPVAPDVADTPQLQNPAQSVSTGTTHLWGFYTVTIDPDTLEVEVVYDRTAMFTANLTNLLNILVIGGIKFEIYDWEFTADYYDFDCLISVTHPFPGYPEYTGYDVRTIFMGDGSASLMYNPDLKYPVVGIDESFQPDPGPPAGENGIPDGYTRWFNVTEFSGEGVPIFEWHPGSFVDPAFDGTATICPYKYYANGLEPHDSLTDWLRDNPDSRGEFANGYVLKRDFRVRFPADEPIDFAYAVICNWGGPDLINDHPSNAPEALACDLEQTGDVYYHDPDQWGGTIGLDIDVFGWGFEENEGWMDSHKMYIESTALSTVYEATPFDMTPVGGGENFSTYSIDIIPDILTSHAGNELWVIAESENHDYSNPIGVMNDAYDDPLTAFFRFDLEVSPEIPYNDLVCDIQILPCSLDYWDITDHVAVKFDASGSYDPNGGPLILEWDFDGDMIYGEPGDDDYQGGDPFFPIVDYYAPGVANLRITSDVGLVSECSVDVPIVEHPTKDIPLRPSPWVARDLAVDPANGDLYAVYWWHEDVNTNWTEIDKYSPCDCFTQPDEPFHATPEGAAYYRMDVSKEHFVVVGGNHDGCSGKIRNITPDGVDLGPNWIIHTRDLWAYNEGGNWEYDHVTIYDFPNPPWNPDGHSTILYRCPWNLFDDWEQSGLIYYHNKPSGHDVLYAGFIRGVDPEATGDSVWCLKDPGNPGMTDYYGTRWKLVSSPGGLSGFNYDNAYFGTGSQSADDDCWYDAADFTRNVNDDLLVLDRMPDGTGRIKAFHGDSVGGEAVGAFDLESMVNSTPIRIDSSDYIDPVYGNLIYVMHGDSTDWYYLSIYFEEELPW